MSDERGYDTKGSRKALGAMNAKLRAKIGRLERELAAYQRAPQPQSAEAVAYVTGYYGGRCVIEPLNRAAVLPTGMALYATPQQSAGVVMPTLVVKETGEWGDAYERGYKAALREFARLNGKGD